VKKAGNELSKFAAGGVVHPPYPVVGGYSVLPKKENVRRLIDELKSARDAAIDFVDIFFNCDFEFETETNFISLVNENYNYLDGSICTTAGYCIPEYSFHQYLEKEVIPYSQAPGFEFEGKPYMVGALARMNLNGGHLNRQTRKNLNQYISVFPSYNVFHNNLAQAIEIVHSIDNSIEILETLEIKEEKPTPFVPKESRGVGVVEAPRGTLYYNLHINREGKIKNANLVIPTSQNQIKMEKDIGAFVQYLLDDGVTDKEKIQHEIEKLIRAYDPCMSCATHFLKIKWL
jgi:coenzyme F420-reducing hydrogenase alpha subunit